MMKKYNELKEDVETYTLAEQQEEIEMRYRSEILGSRLLGEKQGEARGEARGKIKGQQLACIAAIDKRYHVNSKEWVKTLSLNQLDCIFDVIYSEDNYNSFKVKIELL